MQKDRSIWALIGSWYFATSALVAAILILSGALLETMEMTVESITKALQWNRWWGLFVSALFAFFAVGVVVVIAEEVMTIRRKWERRFREFAARRKANRSRWIW